MKHTYRVITPFSRFENLAQFSRMLHKHPVIWHPIFNDDLPFGIHNVSWIDPMYAPAATPGFNPGNWYINWFIIHARLLDDDRYLVLADDDFYEPRFFDKLDEHEGEVLICSMLRGQHQPPGGVPYGTSPLVAAPKNLKIGGVGMEQLVISGRLLKNFRIGPETVSDGAAIINLSKEHKFEFVPEANVWFNYLEPGRWDR